MVRNSMSCVVPPTQGRSSAASSGVPNMSDGLPLAIDRHRNRMLENTSIRTNMQANTIPFAA